MFKVNIVSLAHTHTFSVASLVLFFSLIHTYNIKAKLAGKPTHIRFRQFLYLDAESVHDSGHQLTVCCSRFCFYFHFILNYSWVFFFSTSENESFVMLFVVCALFFPTKCELIKSIELKVYLKLI